MLPMLRKHTQRTSRLNYQELRGTDLSSSRPEVPPVRLAIHTDVGPSQSDVASPPDEPPSEMDVELAEPGIITELPEFNLDFDVTQPLDLSRPEMLDDSIIVIPDSPARHSPGPVIDLSSSPEPEDPPAPLLSASRNSSDGVRLLRCPICMCSLYDEGHPVTTKCGHVYCQTCIQETLQIRKTCPICRKKIKKTDIIHLYLNPSLIV